MSNSRSFDWKLVLLAIGHAILVECSMEPELVLEGSPNVTALARDSAYLNCRVRNLGNRTVSWIRHRDINILTSGRYTYTTDKRFQALHESESEDWTLRIMSAQLSDSGLYECQVSTQPIKSLFIHLDVIEAESQILGEADLFVNYGSLINLTCVVLYSPTPPDHLFWYHNGEPISYDSPRGGVSVITTKEGKVTYSHLLLESARTKDSGKYTCSPSNAKVVSVRVHVLNELQAAMTSKSPKAWTSLSTLVMALLLIPVVATDPSGSPRIAR